MFLLNMSRHIITFDSLKATLGTLPHFPSLKIAGLHELSADQIIASYNKILSQAVALCLNIIVSWEHLVTRHMKFKIISTLKRASADGTNQL